MRVSRPRVPQQVFEHLRENISNHAWAVGDKIPSENVLSRELGVSRVSIRLAIQQFIAMGVLESLHGKGTFIKSNDPRILHTGGGSLSYDECRDTAKVLEFRLIMEPAACFMAAENHDAQMIRTLTGHRDKLIETIGNSEIFVKHDMLFHVEIARASGNPLLEKCLRDVFMQTMHNHKQINAIFGYKDGVYYHSLILKSLESGNAKQAKKVMAEHLQVALDALAKL